MGLLQRKSWQVQDVQHHPVVLGIPLGQDGGPSQGVSIDLGLKSMSIVSLTELADASPKFKLSLTERALNPEDNRTYEEILRDPAPVPMAVKAAEDIMKMPVASAVHPRALERTLSNEKRRLLKDPFFRHNPPSPELFDLVVEAVPGADATVEAREEQKREERAERMRGRTASSGA